MTGDEYNELMAAAARAGESKEYYTEVLNRLSDLRRNLGPRSPWKAEVVMAIDAVHAKLSAISSSNAESPQESNKNRSLKWVLDNIIGVVLSGLILAIILSLLNLD